MWIAIGFGLALFITLFALLGWRFGDQQSTTYGSAGWSTVWTVFKAGLFGARGIRIGDWTGRLGVYYSGAHAITFGEAGCGKGISAILPNVLDQKHLFLVDPGGENSAIAIKSWRDAGLDIRCINFFEMWTDAPWQLPTHGFNPLSQLDPASPTFAADALLFAEMLTPRQDNEGGSTSYFKDASTTLKRAMIIHIKTVEAQASQNLATLYRYVNSDADGWAALLKAMKGNPVCGGLVAQEAIKLERVEAQAPAEFSAIMSTVQQDLSFLADPLVSSNLSTDDVDFSALKGLDETKLGAVISIVLPLQYITSHAAITRLAIACAILAIERAPVAKCKSVFLIDEMAALGKISRFPNWLATLRKYKVSIWSIWQNIGQVKNLYGTDWQTILSNCGLVQFLSFGDLESAEYTEKLLGKCTVRSASTSAKGDRSTSETARSLRFAEELMRMAGGEQIAFIGNLWPVVLNKTPYWKRPDLEGRYLPNPYLDGKSAEPGFADELADQWGKFYYGLVWWLAPHPIAACIIWAAILIPLLLFFSG